MKKQLMLSKERSATLDDLRARTLFTEVPERIIKSLLRGDKVSVARLPARAPLKMRRAGVEYLYIIVSGCLEVRMKSSLIKKGEDFLLAFRGAEQIIGEMRTIAREPGRAFIIASEPCELIEIPTELLISVAEKDWRIYRNIARLLIEKTFQERKRTEAIQMQEGKAQVAQALLNFLDERGAEAGPRRGKKIRGVVRQIDIADYIGCDRTTVNRSLRGLKNQAIIDYPDPGRSDIQRLTIRSLMKLKKIARKRKAS
jgi:CRP-like cAMP-binding protein